MLRILHEVSFVLKFKEKYSIMGSSDWQILDPNDRLHPVRLALSLPATVAFYKFLVFTMHFYHQPLLHSFPSAWIKEINHIVAA